MRIIEYSGFTLTIYEMVLWILFLVNGIIFYKILTGFLTIRENKFVKLAVIVSSSFVSGTIIFNQDYFNITATGIAFLISNMLFFKNSLIEKTAPIFILYPIVVAINFIGDNSLFDYQFWNVDNNFIWEMRAIGRTISICIFWYCIYGLIKNTLLAIKDSLDRKSFIFIHIICMASFVSIYSAILFTPDGKDWQGFIVAVACIITNIGIIFLAGHFAETIKLKKETAYLKTERMYYTQLANNQEHLKKIKHDMDNHLGVVSVLLSQNENGKAMEYCNRLTEQFIVSSRRFCQNSIVNAIINVKYHLAVEQGIDCFINIELPMILPIDDVELCSIFANCFDNAIDASVKLPKEQRNIEVKTKTDKGIFSFSIKNTFNGEINKENNQMISSKSDESNHGHGIKIIETIVNKYHGTMDISFTETHFILLIIIKI